MLIDIAVLVLCGQLLEPLWGALEFLVSVAFFVIFYTNIDNRSHATAACVGNKSLNF